MLEELEPVIIGSITVSLLGELTKLVGGKPVFRKGVFLRKPLNIRVISILLLLGGSSVSRELVLLVSITASLPGRDPD